jgi:hypothetical protein
VFAVNIDAAKQFRQRLPLCLGNIFQTFPQRVLSRLTLVLCPARIIERFSTADFTAPLLFWRSVLVSIRCSGAKTGAKKSDKCT